MVTESDATGKEDHERSGKGDIYQIRVEGHLDSQWSAWFNGFAISHEEDGTTVLTGPIAHQPALHGLLVKIRNLGLVLISVNRIEADLEEADDPG